MSKAVKRVTRAVSRVVKGVTKAVTSVAKGIGKVVSRIAKSPIGKALLMAATVYFGGAAIMGAIGGASAGTGFMGTVAGAIKGAGAGISSAWTGLANAATAFAGGNLSGAGSALSQGFTGANAAGQAAMGGIQAASPNIAMGMQVSGATTAPVASSTVAGQALAPAAQGGGLLGTAAPAASGGFLSDPLVRYGAIQAGTQLAGGLLQGAAADRQAQEERNQQELERMRYNTNVGTQIIRPADEMGNYPTIQEREEQRRIDPVTGQPILAGSPRFLGDGLLGSAFPTDPRTGMTRFPVYNPMLMQGAFR